MDYKADRAKIKEVFKMAGKVYNIDLAVDKDGNSRGFAVIEYDHPVEAVQVSFYRACGVIIQNAKSFLKIF